MATAYTPQQIANAIAQIESGGNYKAHSKTSSASGKYQYIRGTWANYGGYAEAWMAPPEVQDAKALHDITNKLHAYGGDVGKTVMSWFLPAAVSNPALANKVPKGNGISPNQYMAKVLKALGAPLPKSAAIAAVETDPTRPQYPVEERPAAYGTIEGQLANLMAAITTPVAAETAVF